MHTSETIAKATNELVDLISFAKGAGYARNPDNLDTVIAALDEVASENPCEAVALLSKSDFWEQAAD